ncbi:MAG: GGDEF domain-containing phosphodiesterase [Paracoccus sp. (in: a-proteobacteria)]|uniref:GGDEF domain-containing phosphodiesterase n=1 Tax=Paracoccus sp. TaxID=267 RepID=UPI0026E044D3|nr:GGDEF domain-containing phosphodiesterase [Paracoccus sp. (in: a-proteobacteria)]MDO5620732.1 GGDEF domain-containing phosphodiesterase [Paracoccus sp. (in: a-proteobacteria)]
MLIPTAASLLTRLRNLLPRKQSPRQQVLVLRLTQLDGLRQLLGQSGLDRLLMQMRDRLRGCLRHDDRLFAAPAGDFCITLATDSPDLAVQIAMRLRKACGGTFTLAGHNLHPELTGVLVTHDKPGADPAQLASFGRKMLERTPPTPAALAIFAWQPQSDATPDHNFASLIAQGAVQAHFQPQICCDTGAVMGFEALARLNHPSRGLLAPPHFLPGLDDTSRATLTAEMLRQSLEALQKWDDAGWHVPTVSVNVTPQELAEPAFADLVLWELDRQNIPPSRLVIEVIEDLGPHTTGAAAGPNLRRLALAGCRIDLDDFGTGSTTLDAIRQFEVHRLKIDRSFVKGCTQDPQRQRMILAILALADHLDLQTVAEGVESPEEHYFLAQIGCNEVQGYGIAAPMPLDRTFAFMESHSSRQNNLPRLQARAG